MTNEEFETLLYLIDFFPLNTLDTFGRQEPLRTDDWWTVTGYEFLVEAIENLGKPGFWTADDLIRWIKTFLCYN